MSVSVRCIITIDDQKYEAGTDNKEILKETGWAGSTGTFAILHAEILKSLVDAATLNAINAMTDKLGAIKGYTDWEANTKPRRAQASSGKDIKK